MEDWADSILSTSRSTWRSSRAVKRGRERLHERSQETVIAGIGPVGDEEHDDDAY